MLIESIQINIARLFSDVKDRSVLKVVHLNSKTTSSQTLAKQEDSLDASVYIPYTSRPILASEITYQRLSRMGRVPSSTSVSTNSARNESSDEKSMMSAPVNSSTSLMSTSSRSLSEPRRRLAPNESLSAVAMANQKSSTHLAPSGKCGDNISSMCSSKDVHLFICSASRDNCLATKWFNNSNDIASRRRRRGSVRESLELLAEHDLSYLDSGIK